MTSAYAVQWGGPGDIPVPGDYLGLGRSQLALYRPSTGQWLIATAWNPANGAVTSSYVVQWGAAGDIPIPGEYDGGGRVELAVYRPITGQWLIASAYNAGSGAVTSAYAEQFSQDGAIPVPGDYSGAGHADLAVYNPGFAGPSSFIIDANFTAAGGVGAGGYSVGAGGTPSLPSPGAFSGGKKSKVASFSPRNDSYSIAQ